MLKKKQSTVIFIFTNVGNQIKIKRTIDDPIQSAFFFNLVGQKLYKVSNIDIANYFCIFSNH